MSNTFPLYLPNKRQGLLVLPSPLTRAELEMLEEQINNALWIAKEVFIEGEPDAPKVEQPAESDAIKRNAENVE